MASKSKKLIDSEITIEEELEAYSASGNKKKPIDNKKNKSVNKKKNDSDSDSSDSDSSSDDEKDTKKPTKKVIKPAVKKKLEDLDDDSDKDSESDDDFTKSVVAWVKADNKQKEIRGENKLLNNIKKKSQGYIINYFVDNKQTNVSIPGGKIRLNKSTTKVGLKEDHLISILEKKLNSKAKAQKWAQEIYDSRPNSSRVNLKRTKAGKAEKNG
jgi:hypothetical protein